MIEGTTSSSSTIAQKAAEAALDGPQDCVGEMVAGYRLRRDLVVDLLREAGLLLTVPEGGIPLLADVSPTALDFAGVRGAAAAGTRCGGRACSAFGEVAGGAVRISLASSDQDLRDGVGRLCEWVAAFQR